MKFASSKEHIAYLLDRELRPYLEKAKMLVSSPRRKQLWEKLGHDPAGNTQEIARSLWLEERTGESYEKYRKSDLWKIIRCDVLARDGHKCVRCGIQANEVHHRSYNYEVMAGLDDSQLVSICQKCHKLIHYSSPSQKRHRSEWDVVLKTKPTKPTKPKRRPSYLVKLKELTKKESEKGLNEQERAFKRQLEAERDYRTQRRLSRKMR